MDSRSLATIAGTALVTAVLALIPFRASRLHGITDTSGGESKIAHPRVVAGGVEVTLTCLDQELCRQGKEPVFLLKAVNTTATPTGITFDASMDAVRPASRMSRAQPRPTSIWQTQQTLSLEPHGSQELQLKGTMLPENSTVNVTLALHHRTSNQSSVVRMLSFATGEEPDLSAR